MLGYYVQRNADQKIIAKFAEPQPGLAEEFLEGNSEIFKELSWEDIRRMRGALLTASDWTQLPDADLDAQKKAEWTVYRQFLRDIPESFANPNEVIWPLKP